MFLFCLIILSLLCQPLFHWYVSSGSHHATDTNLTSMYVMDLPAQYIIRIWPQDGPHFWHLDWFSGYLKTFSATQLSHIPSNKRMIVNNELPRMWKKVVMNYFKVLLLSLAGENDENHECLDHNWADIQEQFACWVFTAVSVLSLSSINKIISPNFRHCYHCRIVNFLFNICHVFSSMSCLSSSFYSFFCSF